MAHGVGRFVFESWPSSVVARHLVSSRVRNSRTLSLASRSSARLIARIMNDGLE